MTKFQAIKKARAGSMDGCVQHVNARVMPRDSYARQCGHMVGRIAYSVSDWYDGSTVYSFVRGEELGGRC